MKKVVFRIGNINLELVDFFKPGEHLVEGDEVIQRAKALGADLGEELAEELLENKDCIPEEIGEFDIVFPGTIRQIEFSERKIKVIPYLHKQGRNWVKGLGGVQYDWNRQARLARFC